MTETATFSVYNASAGSGKTFTLVKEFLKTLLVSDDPAHYRYILAVTFTNKAVTEMKRRILEALIYFSDDQKIISNNTLAQQILEETILSEAELRFRSQKILKNLLHNYSALSVETIDSFNHRLIRTFARDLKLPSNFEISLDLPQLLEEAVDRLISKTGEDMETTKILLDFALQKIDDDKSWDISKDIVAASSLLLNENDSEPIAKIKKKSLPAFSALRKKLYSEIEIIEKSIKVKAQKVLDIFEKEDIDPNYFPYKTLPNHFLKLAIQDCEVYANKLEEILQSGKPLYKKDTPPFYADKIDTLSPYFLREYMELKALVFRQKLFASAQQNLTPLSVINLVSQELDAIKKEKNIIPIAEFNSLINNEIKDQPVPFIYERLGERYHHFFIDEFQDTSKLQWENIMPLIDNSLSQPYKEKYGSLFMVGDAKQSIYRWRGGLPEQFMALCNEGIPFPMVEKLIFNLDTNRRSREEIIKFNNGFFSFLSKYFGNKIHTHLYITGNDQKVNSAAGGYVNIEFIEKQNKASKNGTYASKVLETIQNLKANGYSDSDICILTRNRKDGIALGVHLMQNNISVVSSETLLLQYSPIVQILNACIYLQIFFDNKEIQIQLLDLLHDKFSLEVEKHEFFSQFLTLNREGFSRNLKSYGIDFDFTVMSDLSLYESCEYCVRQFKLFQNPDAYLFGFMDFIYEFEIQKGPDIISFLEIWENKKSSLSITASEGIEAVQLMTIHKSKGLEFPVVIFPYADVELYSERNAKTWYPFDEPMEGFEEVLINYNSSVENYGASGAQIFSERRNTLELDNINLLYVTLTRAVEKLFIFSETPSIVKENPINYNQLFVEFLKNAGRWQEDQTVYEFGYFEKKTNKPNQRAMRLVPNYISTKRADHNLNIVPNNNDFDSTRSVALDSGNLLHNSMQNIFTVVDAEMILTNYRKRGILSADDLLQLKNKIDAIILHPQLKHLFAGGERVEIEREIISAAGAILRPDRLNFHTDSSVTIMDYKTGNPIEKHTKQINSYAYVLEEMGITVIKKYLVYSSEGKIIINKV